MAAGNRSLLQWSTVMPVVALLALGLTWGRDLGPVLVGLIAVVLAAAVLAAYTTPRWSRTGWVSRSGRWSWRSPSR